MLQAMEEIRKTSETDFQLSENRPDYPSKPRQVPYGMGLFVTQDVPAGTVLERFEGPDVDYDAQSDYDKTYVLNYLPNGGSKWIWLLPKSNARFANHACDPNAFINQDLELVARRPLKKDDQITFLYNNGDEVKDWWDPIWNFECHCGAEKCQKMIDRYRKFEGSLSLL